MNTLQNFFVFLLIDTFFTNASIFQGRSFLSEALPLVDYEDLMFSNEEINIEELKDLVFGHDATLHEVSICIEFAYSA